MADENKEFETVSVFGPSGAPGWSYGNSADLTYNEKGLQIWFYPAESVSGQKIEGLLTIKYGDRSVSADTLESEGREIPYRFSVRRFTLHPIVSEKHYEGNGFGLFPVEIEKDLAAGLQIAKALLEKRMLELGGIAQEILPGQGVSEKDIAGLAVYFVDGALSCRSQILRGAKAKANELFDIALALYPTE